MTASRSPFSLKNIRLFMAFRVLFTARFYYPVFTILFLDYGLTIEQFSLLNTVWAFTIVCAEVPSGALADLLGRKRLMLYTAWCMIVEMAIIAFIPLGNPALIFPAFFINRIFSGLAEAMASGADEAMAYDTLVAAGLKKEWPRVLDYQMRAKHVGYIFAMTLGSMVYDAAMLNRILGWLGWQVQLSQQTTMRFPVYLTLLLAILALLTTLQMRDPLTEENGDVQERRASVRQVLKLTLQAGTWILHTPFALSVILYAMVFDHTLRILVTMNSQYYRIIGLSEAWYGVIGSAVAVIGFFVPGIARTMTSRFPAAINGGVLTVFSLTALFLLTLFLPYYGIVPVMMLYIGMTLTSFFTSHYLNEIATSEQRATVLSFKGLAYNAAYGVIGIFYAGLIAHLKSENVQMHPQWAREQISDAAFKGSVLCFPWYMIGALGLVSVVCIPRLAMQKKSNSSQKCIRKP